ncbi:MAG: hypothetical protein JNL73_11020 [Anaerolineales bacterium]|nr:hypothetical protein [Anaerolineales bacterium]
MDKAHVYRINTENLALRREFIRLAEADRQALVKLSRWGEQHALEIARAFYDHQFAFSETRAFFERYAAKHGRSLEQLRHHLEQAQAGYLTEIFAEAGRPEPFGLPYFEKRLKVGRLHNAIDLPLKWYIGSYTVYQDLIHDRLLRTHALQPGLRRRAERAIAVVFNFDMQAIAEAFFNDMLESFGVDLKQVTVAEPRFDISDYFAQIKQALQQALSEMAYSSRELATASLNLDAAVRQSSQATGQIAAAMGQMALGATNQAAGVTRTAQSVAQIHRGLDGIAKGAQEQATAASQATAATTHLTASLRQVTESAQAGATDAAQAAQIAASGAQAVEAQNAAMRAINESVGAAAQQIRELGSHSDQIGTIVATIDEIAGQTNLLALNAAIEAARAGEHGRGFAVVADEVRKLAERSGVAAREISGLIGVIRRIVGESVQKMERSATEVQTGTSRAAEASEALDRILQAARAVSAQVSTISTATQGMTRSANDLVTSVESVSAVIEENSAATEEMAANSAEVSEAIEHFAAISEENSATVEEVSAAAEQMSAQVLEVGESAKTLSEMALRLQSAVGRFNFGEEPGRPATEMHNSVRVIATRVREAAKGPGSAAIDLDRADALDRQFGFAGLGVGFDRPFQHERPGPGREDGPVAFIDGVGDHAVEHAFQVFCHHMKHALALRIARSAPGLAHRRDPHRLAQARCGLHGRQSFPIAPGCQFEWVGADCGSQDLFLVGHPLCQGARIVTGRAGSVEQPGLTRQPAAGQALLRALRAGEPREGVDAREVGSLARARIDAGEEIVERCERPALGDRHDRALG